MDFKFSCKWFDVQFSGDPGYVEGQLAKFDPYISAVLERIKLDAESGETSPAPAEPATKTADDDAPEPGNERQRGPGRGYDKDRGYDRDRGYDKDRGYDRDNRSNRRGRDRKHSAGRRDSYSKVASAPARDEGDERSRGRFRPDDMKKDDPDPGAVAKPEEEKFSAPAAIEADAAKKSDAETEASLPEKAPEQKPPKDGAEDKRETQKPEFAKRRRAPRIRAEDLKKTVDDKKPRTHHDRIMVYGYYMEERAGGSDFTVAELKRCYRAAEQDPGVNIEQVINHASRSGFVVKNDSGRTVRFKLSSKGKGYVEDGLKLS